MVNTLEQDDVKRRQRAQQVALFRYQLICPALDPGLSTKQRGRIVRAHRRPQPMPARSAGSSPVFAATPWTGGSAATGPAGSTR